MKNSGRFVVVSREELDRLLSGNLSVQKDVRPFEQLQELQWPQTRRKDELLAVFWHRVSTDSPQPPGMILLPEAGVRETLAWIATYLPGAAPISQWCRVITPPRLRSMDDVVCRPKFDGLEAAWAGAVIGEVLARQLEPLTDISLVWCQSSATFAFARANALWPEEKSPQSLFEELEEARRLLRAESRRELPGLLDLWRVMVALQRPESRLGVGLEEPLRVILAACRDIVAEGVIGSSTARQLDSLVSFSGEVAEIDSLNAEDRVRLIDRIEIAARDLLRQADRAAISIASFLVGYAVARVGAGAANLDLLRPFASSLPIAAVWCPAIAGFHKPQSWSSALNGLGRLVVRELMQPLHLDQMPNVDISLEELRVMMNPRVQYKRLPFRPASLRVAIVELLPGVSIAVSLSSDIQSRADTASPATREPPEVGATSDKSIADLVSEIRRILDRFTPKPSVKPSSKQKSKSRGRTPRLL